MRAFIEWRTVLRRQRRVGSTLYYQRRTVPVRIRLTANYLLTAELVFVFLTERVLVLGLYKIRQLHQSDKSANGSGDDRK